MVKQQQTSLDKLKRLNVPVLLIIVVIAMAGLAMLYSASGGNLSPWVSRQLPRFVLGMCILVCFAIVDLRVWLQHAYSMYMAVLALLVGVEFAGFIGMGAQRWIDLYLFQIQPSELMKITLILALARYFHGKTLEQVRMFSFLLPPTLMILAPTFLVLRQPDLGTAILIVLLGFSMFFLAGIRWWKTLSIGLVALASAPVIWMLLRPYQRERILTFLDPERDPLGAGYHIMQSKIAFGSGGLFGKGFMQGSQSHLDFLPEKQTDFIFTMLCEEFGMLGGIIMLCLYVLIFIYGYWVSFICRSPFGSYIAMGVTTILFLYVFINTAMVMGLVPVVGVPLPLVSYGGTSMLTVMMGLGLLMCADIHRYSRLGRLGG